MPLLIIIAVLLQILDHKNQWLNNHTLQVEDKGLFLPITISSAEGMLDEEKIINSHVSIHDSKNYKQLVEYALMICTGTPSRPLVSIKKLYIALLLCRLCF